ncbi:hypothetical protein KIN20_011994 [Parelaphostrongylus tenuis]|uniref:EGF-like domain-containing protein n=1 Tax=Parelaphostrongylus tenuis TaxID=148309 RepID=A0AAD5MBK4_PARTN|nr:hypothetical protein KIN20_011994 [Parelaphostrongylus tenuis]
MLHASESPGLNCATNPSICAGGSFCIRGICTCPVGTKVIDGFCVPSTNNQFTYAPPGAICVDGEVLCTGNSVCANGYCVCPGGERIQNEMCIPVDSQADPGQMCEAGLTVCTGNSHCDKGVCRCPVGQVSLNGQCARIVKQLPVQVSNQCIPPCGINSVCIIGKCQCIKGFVLHEGVCTSQNQNTCPSGACCSEKCPCTHDPSANTALCSQPLLHSPFFGAPGQQCDLRQGALLCRGKALCIRNQCVCPMNLILSKNECVDFVGDSYPGQSCSRPGTICRGGSSCSEGICKCGFGLTITNLQCVPSAGNINPRPVIFTFAPRPFRPLTTLPPLVLRTFTTFSTYSNFPRNVIAVRPGAACDPTCEFRQCYQRCGGGSVCVGGVCICPVGMYDYLGVCTPLAGEAATTRVTPAQVRFARPGDPCDISIRCTGGSACVIGTCTCNPGYAPSLDRSSCVLVSLAMSSRRSFTGRTCTHDDDCVLPLRCFREKCICSDGQLPIDEQCHDNGALPYPGSQCVDRCAHGATCVSGYCICAHNLSTNASGHCVLHSPSKETFSLPGAPCVHKVTACHGNSECVHGVGDSCVFHGDCTSIPMTACINFHCNCIAGYHNISGMCELDRKDIANSCKSYSECDPPRICGLKHTCECPFTMFEATDGVCRYRNIGASIGSYCNETTTCMSPSTCASHICTCPAGFVVINSACVPELTDAN